jgi:hypothetical protein
VRDRPQEAPPAIVPATRRARPAGEVRARWAWAEPTVWTERMLMALDAGVKGGRWYSLMDKVYTKRNLRAAFARVKANRGAAGVDHVGWFEYFQHSSRGASSGLDGWVRMRLRSILRKRSGRRGRGRGKDHQRWPNSFFTAHGLYSLVAAHAAVRQSSRRSTTNWRAVCGRTACTVRRGEGPGT